MMAIGQDFDAADRVSAEDSRKGGWYRILQNLGNVCPIPLATKNLGKHRTPALHHIKERARRRRREEIARESRRRNRC